jgi:hypothetical protein
MHVERVEIHADYSKCGNILPRVFTPCHVLGGMNTFL